MLLAVALIISVPYALIFLTFTFRNEYIVIKNEYKYVARVEAFLQTDVLYYDYRILGIIVSFIPLS